LTRRRPLTFSRVPGTPEQGARSHRAPSTAPPPAEVSRCPRRRRSTPLTPRSRCKEGSDVVYIPDPEHRQAVACTTTRAASSSPPGPSL
jgi:hypothetical protein